MTLLECKPVTKLTVQHVAERLNKSSDPASGVFVPGSNDTRPFCLTDPFV